MENYVEVVTSSIIYDVSFQDTLYEVHVCGDEIVSIYREDSQDLSKEELEGVRDFVYNTIENNC